jgi:hypothetical protein
MGRGWRSKARRTIPRAKYKRMQDASRWASCMRQRGQNAAARATRGEVLPGYYTLMVPGMPMWYHDNAKCLCIQQKTVSSSPVNQAGRHFGNAACQRVSPPAHLVIPGEVNQVGYARCLNTSCTLPAKRGCGAQDASAQHCPPAPRSGAVPPRMPRRVLRARRWHELPRRAMSHCLSAGLSPDASDGLLQE